MHKMAFQPSVSEGTDEQLTASVRQAQTFSFVSSLMRLKGKMPDDLLIFYQQLAQDGKSPGALLKRDRIIVCAAHAVSVA